MSVRIGFLQNRRDRPTKWGTCHTGPPNAGLITVESSTSGVFFRGFPHVCTVLSATVRVRVRLRMGLCLL